MNLNSSARSTCDGFSVDTVVTKGTLPYMSIK